MRLFSKLPELRIKPITLLKIQIPLSVDVLGLVSPNIYKFDPGMQPTSFSCHAASLSLRKRFPHLRSPRFLGQSNTWHFTFYVKIREKIDTKMENTDWAKMDSEYFEISSVSGTGIPELIKRIGKLLNEN